MKIAHILQFLGIGGLEKVLLLLIKEQIKAGHDVTVFVYDYEQSWVDYYKDNGIKVVTKFQKKPGFDYSLVKKLSAQLKEFHVIHSHDLNPMIYMGLLCLKYKLKRYKHRPKFIHTTHGMEHIKYTPKTKWYEFIFARCVDRIITVSLNYKLFYESLGISPKKIYNIDNGIGLSCNGNKKRAKEKVIAEYSLAPSNKIWCTLARVVPLKDQKLLISLVKSKPNITLLIIGPSGDQEYWDELHSMASDNVIFCGPKQDVNTYLSASDLFLSASHHEGLPISVLEAGALNIPCVLSNIPGHKVLIKENEKEIACFFEVGDLKSLEKAVTKVEQNTRFTKDLITNMKKTIEQHYSAFNMFTKVESVYGVSHDK